MVKYNNINFNLNLGMKRKYKNLPIRTTSFRYQQLLDYLYEVYHYSNVEQSWVLNYPSSSIIPIQSKMAVQYCHVGRTILESLRGDEIYEPIFEPAFEKWLEDGGDLVEKVSFIITEHRLDPHWINDYDVGLIIPYNETATIHGCFMDYFEANHQYIDSVIEHLRKTSKSTLIFGTQQSEFAFIDNGVMITDSFPVRLTGNSSILHIDYVGNIKSVKENI